MSGIETLSPACDSFRVMRPPFAITFAFLFLLSLLGCQAPTGGSAPEAGVLRIGTSLDYRPFSHPAPDAAPEPRGFSIDVARTYAAATGRRVEFVPFRWPELAADLEGDRFDLALSGVTVRADRSIAGRFSLPVTVSGAVVLVPADSALEDARSLASPGLTFAVNAGGHLERTARALFSDARILPVANNASVLERIDDPEVDGVVTDSLEAPHWQARRGGLREIGPLTRDRKAAWFPIGSDAERARFDVWLMEAERDGTLAAIRRRHGLPADQTARPGRALLAVLDERLSLMTEVARVKQVMGRPIEDRPREAKVLDRAVAALAREAEARRRPAPNEDGVRTFYQAQIEAAKTIQRDWTNANPGHAAPSQDPAWLAAEDRLGAEVRPALLDLGDRIATLVVLTAASGEPAPGRSDVANALGRHSLPAADLDAIHASLERILSAD